MGLFVASTGLEGALVCETGRSSSAFRDEVEVLGILREEYMLVIETKKRKVANKGAMRTNIVRDIVSPLMSKECSCSCVSDMQTFDYTLLNLLLTLHWLGRSFPRLKYFKKLDQIFHSSTLDRRRLLQWVPPKSIWIHSAV